MDHYSRELHSKDMSLKAAAIELEQANTSYFTADSKVLTLEKELKRTTDEANDGLSAITELKDKVGFCEHTQSPSATPSSHPAHPRPS